MTVKKKVEGIKNGMYPGAMLAICRGFLRKTFAASELRVSDDGSRIFSDNKEFSMFVDTISKIEIIDCDADF
ncbi:MAG: hypothetical protein Athens071425_59 [Parcubacteria group bacterium Athens0714_25]|nr:MAG: hypothetical protein Athens071425_59 [Parcubacteria group bacterium Athens0714_25]